MNTIATFRKCTLSDSELIEKVDKLTDDLYKAGKVPTIHVPARPDEDYDLLVGELILRFRESIEPKVNIKLVRSNDSILEMIENMDKVSQEDLEKPFTI